MRKPQEVEGWARFFPDGSVGVTVNTKTQHVLPHYRPCVVTPKPLWDQRQEAIRKTLEALQGFMESEDMEDYIDDVSKGLALLRALPGIELDPSPDSE